MCASQNSYFRHGILMSLHKVCSKCGSTCCPKQIVLGDIRSSYEKMQSVHIRVVRIPVRVDSFQNHSPL
jgi:hypothetical protein